MNMHTKLNDRSKAIVAAIEANNWTLVDDHNSSSELVTKPVALGLYSRDGKQQVVALYDRNIAKHYSVNRIDLVDGVPHLTRDSVTTMMDASFIVEVDLINWKAGFDWEAIAKTPALHPGELELITHCNANLS